MSLIENIDPADIEKATALLGGNRAAAMTLLRNHESAEAAVYRYRANQIKRLEERQKKTATARKAAVAVLRTMQDEPHWRERGEYISVWTDLLSRVDADIQRDTADLARLRSEQAEATSGAGN